MTLSFGELFALTFQKARQYLGPLALGALLVTILYVALQIILIHGAMNQAGTTLNTLGVKKSPQEIQQLMQRAQQGDDAAKLELNAAMGELQKDMQAMGQEKTEKTMLNTLRAQGPIAIPAMIVFALLTSILLITVSAYYLLLGLEEGLSLSDRFMRSIQLVLPFVGISIWKFIRSFVWIPILVIGFGTLLIPTLHMAYLIIPFIALPAAVILMLIFYPRFAIASIIYVQEKAGIRESVERSYQRTNGYWGKIFGNLLLWLICISVVAWVVNMILSAGTDMLLNSGSYRVQPLLTLFVTLAPHFFLQQIIIGVSTLFTVQLAFTIMNNPRAPLGTMMPLVARPVMPKSPLMIPVAKKMPPKKAPPKTIKMDSPAPLVSTTEKEPPAQRPVLHKSAAPKKKSPPKKKATPKKTINKESALPARKEPVDPPSIEF